LAVIYDISNISKDVELVKFLAVVWEKEKMAVDLCKSFKS